MSSIQMPLNPKIFYSNVGSGHDMLLNVRKRMKRQPDVAW